jgi:hypothetical protein
MEVRPFLVTPLNRYFENFILLGIITNSISMTLYDYSEAKESKTKNMAIDKIGEVFTIIFLVEAILKIIAQGFVVSKFAYLRDGWNVIDFTIVFAGVLEFI